MNLAPLTPRDWQEADIAKIVSLLSPEVGALVTSAPGAGKTLLAVEVIKRMKPETVLIIAPPSTHNTAWVPTLKRQGVDLPVYKLVGSQAKQRLTDLASATPGIYITSAQWFTRQKWGKIQPDMVVIDEVHMLGKHGNKGQRALNGYARSKGLTAKWRIAMSGTPWRNKFDNAWAIANWVEPKSINPEYWAWRVEECDGKWDNFAPQNLLVTGEKVPGRLVSRMSCVIHHSQRGRCCDFHPGGFLAGLEEPVRIQRELEMTAEQGKFYRSMEKSFFGFLTTPDASGHLPVVAELPIVARGMLRFCALGLPSVREDEMKLFFESGSPSPKLDQLEADLAALDGEPVLAFTHSAQFATLAAERMAAKGFRVEAWTGGLTEKRRTDIRERFMLGELDAIIGVISAMGTGTDGLQESANNMVFLSVDDDASNNTQGVSRLDRLGQKRQVVIFEYLMSSTLDVGHLDKQLQSQLDLNRTILEGLK